MTCSIIVEVNCRDPPISCESDQGDPHQVRNKATKVGFPIRAADHDRDQGAFIKSVWGIKKRYPKYPTPNTQWRWRRAVWGWGILVCVAKCVETVPHFSNIRKQYPICLISLELNKVDFLQNQRTSNLSRMHDSLTRLCLKGSYSIS